MGLLKTTIAAALLLFVSWGIVKGAPAADQGSDCSVRFQEAIQEVIQLKNTCRGGVHYKDCCQISQFSSLFTDVSLETGIYDITTHTLSEVTFLVNAPSKSKARCDMESDGGGWTVLVRRTPDVDERVNFARKWAEYENGFGNLSTEFWYGLKLMHDLTSREPMEVQIEMKKSGQPAKIFSYGEFRVDGPDTLYTLHVSDAKQGGFDPFAHHNERKFSTAERDNDNHGTNCATGYNNDGGWWLGHCIDLTLTANNAIVHDGSQNYVQHEYAELRVRPKSCVVKTTSCSSE